MTQWKGIQKCYPFEEKRLATWTPPFFVQPKLDGDRCKNEPLPNDVNLLLSSSENPFFSVPHIAKDIKTLGFERLPLDGELYSHDLFLEGGHELINSIASRSTNLHPRHKELEFHVFDLRIFNVNQYDRISKLLKMSFPDNLSIKFVPTIVCNTLSDIKKAYDKFIKLGYEGIIVRHFWATYVDKRSIGVMKFKPKESDTYTIVGWKEEVSITGQPKGRIGSLILSSQEGDTFSVGAGLDDEQKDRLWIMRDSIGGQEATVFYQHLTNKKIPKGTFDIKIEELGIR